VAIGEKDFGLRPQLAANVRERDETRVARPAIDASSGFERVDRLGVVPVFGQLLATRLELGS
jgi:hypothetical protein